VSDATKPADLAVPTGADEVRKFLKRARRGDASTLPALRAMLRDPAAVDLLGGDLARRAEQSLLNAAAGEDLAFKQALTRKLELLRTEVAGANPTPVERLLVERIVACWLHLAHLEAVHVDLRGRPGGIPLALDAHYQRCISSAQRRYLAAIKALAVVRKLAVPVLQLNIARKQINVAGSCVAAGGGGATP
jgi:hypothetical protein